MLLLVDEYKFTAANGHRRRIILGQLLEVVELRGRTVVGHSTFARGEEFSAVPSVIPSITKQQPRA